jgi:hypothetical protein
VLEETRMKKDILSAIEEAMEWLEIDGVVSVGRGREAGEDCIFVTTSRRVEEIRERIPTRLHGHAVEIASIGKTRAE